MKYLERIESLIKKLPERMINLEQTKKRTNPPTQAFSEFVIKREQGDWAEDLLFRAIQEINRSVVPVRYGRTDKIIAGEPKFEEFYKKYQEELDKIGKRPDLLIFKAEDYNSNWNYDISSLDSDLLTGIVRKAIAAFEIRSSAYLVGEYEKYTNRTGKRKRQFLSFTPKVEDIYVIYK